MNLSTSNRANGTLIVSAMIAQYDATAMRSSYVEALALSGVGEDGHGDTYAALALDLLESGHGRHSLEWRALNAAFDIVCRFDATAQPLATRGVTLTKRVNLAKRANPTVDTLSRSGL